MPVLMWLVRWLGWAGLGAAGVALALAGVIWADVERNIARDAEQIRFLNTEIEKLDPQIAEVAHLRDIIAKLLARKQVAEVLQADRPIVQVLEEIARRRPAGTYLAVVQNTGRDFVVSGYAASVREADVFLRSVAESPLFQDAALVQSFSEAAPPQRAYPLRFVIVMSQRREEVRR